MASYVDANGICEISLKIDDVDSGIPASNFRFKMYDSIHELYPRVSFYYNDTLGQAHEYMAFVNGTKITISFGVNSDNWKTCSYRVCENSTPEQTSSSYVGGQLQLKLKHDYCFSQTKTSNAYNDDIYSIIKDLVKKYTFDKIDIDTTYNLGYWYQPYICDDEFIVKYLLPYAYSTQASNSPYYCWIDNSNIFHFKHYKSLFSQNPVKTLYYKSQGIFESMASDDSIGNLCWLQNSNEKDKKYYNRIPTYFDKNGEFVKGDNLLLTDYPKGETNPIPVKVNMDCVTDIISQFDNDIEDDETENNRLGYEINQHSKSINVDKVVLNLKLDRTYNSGQLIDLRIPSVSDDVSNELSLRTSGIYLIESCYHTWSGKTASTTLICSKQVVKVTEEYRNYQLIVNR